jgi:flagellin-like hook-associated protein FlgL
MAGIVLSNGIRSNLLSLQNSSSLLDQTQNRLARGRKVNTALDDPLAYFQSESLNSRANDLNRLLDGIGLGIKTLETADNALRQMTRLVETAQAGARAALQSNATNAKLGSGMDPVTRTSIDYNANPNLVGTGGKFQAGDIFTISGTDNLGAPFSFTVTMGAAPYTAQNFVDAINASPPGVAGTVNAQIDVAGRLIIDNVKGGNLRIQLTTDVGTANTLNDLFGTFEPPLPTSTPTDTGVIIPTVNPTRQAYATQYIDLIAQITNLAKDAGYNGTNLLYGQSLNMVFNEDATTKMIVKGVVFDAAGIGLANTDVQFKLQSDVEINAALTKLGNAIKYLRGQAAVFAANNNVALTRQDFTKEAIKTLKSGADNLVVADMNEEGANLLALQTRQQLSVQALSLASRSDQAVLRLFG